LTRWKGDDILKRFLESLSISPHSILGSVGGFKNLLLTPEGDVDKKTGK
jgi:hypothetical protein